MMLQFGDLNRRWIAEAEQIFSLSKAGRQQEAIGRFFGGTFTDIGLRANLVYRDWVQLQRTPRGGRRPGWVVGHPKLPTEPADRHRSGDGDLQPAWLPHLSPDRAAHPGPEGIRRIDRRRRIRARRALHEVHR